MFTFYTLIKFIHILAAIVWVGGAFTFALLNGHIARTRDADAMAALLRQGEFYGRSVMGPSAMTTLVAGIVMVAMSEFGFGALWVTWGFIAIFGSMIIGAVLMGRVQRELAHRVPGTPLDDPGVTALLGRLSRLNIIVLVLLLSAVGAMVFKPVL